MVGRDINLQVEKSKCEPGEVVLKLEHVCADPVFESSGVKDISLELRRGEILGIAGVDGNGQEDLSELIMGLRRLTSGKITSSRKGCQQIQHEENAENAHRLHTG